MNLGDLDAMASIAIVTLVGGWIRRMSCGQHFAQLIEHEALTGLGDADHGAKDGIGIGIPLRAEAVGHLTKDHARAQHVLADVVGRRHIAMGHADKWMLTITGNAATQPFCRPDVLEFAASNDKLHRNSRPQTLIARERGASRIDG